MATAGSVNLVFAADTSSATRGLKRMRSETKRTTEVFDKMKGGLSSFVGALSPVSLGFAAAGGAIAGFTAKVMESQKETTLWADRLGVSVSKLDGITKFAKQFGGSLDDVGDSMKDLNERIADAAGGNKTYEEALNKVGLASKDLINLPVEEQFLKVADAIGKLNNVGDQNFVTAELMADAGFRLLPMFRKGEGAIRSFTTALEENNAVMTADTAQSAADMEKAFASVGIAAETIFTKAFGWFNKMSLASGKLSKDWSDFARQLTGETDWRSQLEQWRGEGQNIAAQSEYKQADVEKQLDQKERIKAVKNYQKAIDEVYKKQEFHAKMTKMWQEAELKYLEEKAIKKKEAEIAERSEKIKDLETLASGSGVSSAMALTARSVDPNQMRFGGASATRISEQVRIQRETKATLERTKTIQEQALTQLKVIAKRSEVTVPNGSGQK